MLLSAQEGTVTLSLAHKRASKAESGQVVLDGELTTAVFDPGAIMESEKAFLSSLSLSSQPSANLFTLYRGWMDKASALSAARITGKFSVGDTCREDARRSALAEYYNLRVEISALRGQAEKETQLNRRVDMNLKIQRMEVRVGQVKDLL